MSEDIHKWTDGRYTLMFDEHTFFVYDNEKEKRMTALQVTKKLNEQQATITNLQGDVERLKYIIEELRKDNYNKFELINKMKKEEKLYAKEILRLNELNKQTSEFTDILGGY